MAPNPLPPPPWKNQRIRGARVAWAPKNNYNERICYYMQTAHNVTERDGVGRLVMKHLPDQAKLSACSFSL